MRKYPINQLLNNVIIYIMHLAKCMNIYKLSLVSLSDNKELKCKSYFIKYAKKK